MKEYNFTKEEFNEFIAAWLNSDHQDYSKYVRGAKLFLEFLEDKAAQPSTKE